MKWCIEETQVVDVEVWTVDRLSDELHLVFKSHVSECFHPEAVTSIDMRWCAVLFDVDVIVRCLLCSTLGNSFKMAGNTRLINMS